MALNEFTAETIARFIDHLESQAMAENTVTAYTADLFGARVWIGNDGYSCSTEEITIKYLNAMRKTWAASTIKRKIACLRAYGRWLGYPDFLANYKAPKIPSGVAHPLPGGITDILKMENHARKPHHRAMVILVGLLGLRISEARSVTVQDFDDSSGDIVLTVRGKGDKTRHLPVDHEVMRLLDEPFRVARLRADGLLLPTSDRATRRAWTRIGERAGLRTTATHDGRMTFGTAAYDRHKDLRAVQDLLGHSSSQTTETYTGVTMAKKRASAAVL